VNLYDASASRRFVFFSSFAGGDRDFVVFAVQGTPNDVNSQNSHKKHERDRREKESTTGW